MAFLLATITLTLAAPREEVPEQKYNYTETKTFTSEPIPEIGYSYNATFGRHSKDEESIVVDRETAYDNVPVRHSVTKTYFQFLNKAKITTLEITNLKAENNGGRVSVVAGGVGKDFVKLHFLSEPNNVLNYEIKIFGVSEYEFIHV